jgi:hypothetical protein
MSRSIALATDVEADPARLTEILSTTDGQRGFWTADCDVATDHARFGFEDAPVDLETTVTVEAGKLVRMHVTSGYAFWVNTTWEWELGAPMHDETSTGVTFRHYGLADDVPDAHLAFVTQTWAMILDRLAKYAATGTPQPFFPATA